MIYSRKVPRPFLMVFFCIYSQHFHFNLRMQPLERFPKRWFIALRYPSPCLAERCPSPAPVCELSAILHTTRDWLPSFRLHRNLIAWEICGFISELVASLADSLVHNPSSNMTYLWSVRSILNLESVCFHPTYYIFLFSFPPAVRFVVPPTPASAKNAQTR